MSLNKLVISGRLGQKPMLREFAGGGAVTNFSIAHTRHKGRGEARQTITEWYNCSLWDRPAEILCEEAMRGQVITVMGRLVTNTYEKESTKEIVKEIEIEVEGFELGRLPRASAEGPK